MSEAGRLMVTGAGLILCLLVFTLVISLLCYRLSSADESEDCLKRFEAIEKELATIKYALRKHSILPKSQRDIESPPLHIRDGA